MALGPQDIVDVSVSIAVAWSQRTGGDSQESSWYETEDLHRTLFFLQFCQETSWHATVLAAVPISWCDKTHQTRLSAFSYKAHTAIQGQQKQNPKRLPNVEARFYCRQANLNLYFQCRDDAFKLKEMFLGFRRAAHTWKSWRIWAARYNTWLLIQLTPKGVVFSFLMTLNQIANHTLLSLSVHGM